MDKNNITRRTFVAQSLAAAPVLALGNAAKKRLALVGTGHRGSGMWGHELLQTHGNVVEYVASATSIANASQPPRASWA